MGKVTKRDKQALDQLVLDCSIFNFHENEAREYIEKRFGKEISGRTYRRYKKNLENGNMAQEWMNYFSRIGFVVIHQQVCEGAKYLLESSMRRLLKEENKEKQDDYFILKLKEEIRKDLEVVSEFSLGTPVLTTIKERMQKLEKRVRDKDEMLRETEEKLRIESIRNRALMSH